MTTLAVVHLRANVETACGNRTHDLAIAKRELYTTQAKSHSFDMISEIKVKYIKHKNKNVKISGSDSD